MASMYTTHQASGAKQLGTFSEPDNIQVTSTCGHKCINCNSLHVSRLVLDKAHTTTLLQRRLDTIM